MGPLLYIRNCDDDCGVLRFHRTPSGDLVLDLLCVNGSTETHIVEADDVKADPPEARMHVLSDPDSYERDLEDVRDWMAYRRLKSLDC